jgi:hypothetical protein
MLLLFLQLMLELLYAPNLVVDVFQIEFSLTPN